MLSVISIAVHFGGRPIFEGMSFQIRPTDRIGLVGKNGAGKTTLLRILANEQSPDEGKIARPNEFTLGYLPQEGIGGDGEKSVYAEACTAFEETLAIEKALHDIIHQLETRTDFESEEYTDLTERCAVLSERFSMVGGTTMQAEVEKILTGLGFVQKDFDRPTKEFSGGWRMRLELAKILLRRPSCILLDEPTNHLDIESVQWLEQFLSRYEGSIVLVSHDRAFLDAVTNRTLEIEGGKLHDYPCSYSKYVERRAERREQMAAAYKNQQKSIADTEKFIERFRYKASKASQVQSRVKQLEKIDRIEIEDEDNSSIGFRFPPAPRSGRVVIEAQNIHKYYDVKHVLKGVDFAIERGEKVAFIGKNGEGKSTFSKIIAGLEEYKGSLQIGHNVAIGYYAQHQADMLNGDDTVFQVIDKAAQGEIRLKIRSLLGAFLFSGDAVDKKVKVLSGGEKSRLSLCKLLLDPYNLLIFDEPTNHLDMRSKTVLKEAIRNFEGAAIIVSHDRDFLQGLTDKVVEFKNGSLKEYPGDVYEYLRLKQTDTIDKATLLSVAPATSAVAGFTIEKPINFGSSSNPTKEQNEEVRRKRKDVQREERRLQKLIEEQESAIETLEKRIAQAEETFASGAFIADSPQGKIILEQYAADKLQLEKTVEQWEQTSLGLEQLQTELESITT